MSRWRQPSSACVPLPLGMGAAMGRNTTRRSTRLTPHTGQSTSAALKLLRWPCKRLAWLGCARCISGAGERTGDGALGPTLQGDGFVLF